MYTIKIAKTKTGKSIREFNLAREDDVLMILGDEAKIPYLQRLLLVKQVHKEGVAKHKYQTMSSTRKDARKVDRYLTVERHI